MTRTGSALPLALLCIGSTIFVVDFVESFLWCSVSSQYYCPTDAVRPTTFSDPLFPHYSSYKVLHSCLLLSTTPFDFASPTEWDAFYRRQQRQHQQEDQMLHDGNSRQPLIITTEWHDSIALEDIATVVPSHSRCLLVGCGTSRLPEVLLHQPAPPRSLVLMDTSPTCLEQLKALYGNVGKDSSTTTHMEYVCGDATRLCYYFGTSVVTDNKSSSGDPQQTRPFLFFDMIIDKGLTDAILCSEGWDGPLESMLREASQILTPVSGQYLLISYQLPRTTREFLEEVGRDVGLEWQFDVDLTAIAQHLQVPVTDEAFVTGEKRVRPSSSSRVSVALATKIAAR